MTFSAADVFRTESGEPRAPWRVLGFGIFLFAAMFFVAQAGAAIGGVVPLAGWARSARLSLDVTETAIAVLLATWAAGRAVHGEHHDVWRIVGLDPVAWRPRVVFSGLALGALVLAVPVLLMVPFGAMHFESAQAVESTTAIVWSAFALMLPAAVWEEVLMRGYVFAACRDGAGTISAVAITSVGFGLAHVANPDPSVVAIVAVTGAGVFLAIVRVVTGSLVAAIAAHLAFNLMQVVVLHAPVSGIAVQTPAYRMVSVGPDWLTGGAWGPEGGVAVMASLALASFLLLRYVRVPPPELLVAAAPDIPNP
jgi:membrane protease YdiL (CAAX protease family)